MNETNWTLLEKVQKLSLYSAQRLYMVSGPTNQWMKNLDVTGKSREVVPVLCTNVEHGIRTNNECTKRSGCYRKKSGSCLWTRRWTWYLDQQIAGWKNPDVIGKSPEVVRVLYTNVEHSIWSNKSMYEKVRVLPEKVRKLSLYSAQTLNIVSGPTNQCMKRSRCYQKKSGSCPCTLHKGWP